MLDFLLLFPTVLIAENFLLVYQVNLIYIYTLLVTSIQFLLFNFSGPSTAKSIVTSVRQYARFFISSLEDEADQMTALERLGEPFGLINCFTEIDVASLYITFFSQFHVAATAVSNTMNLICFMKFFIEDYIHTTAELKLNLFEVKQVLDKHHKATKKRARADTKANLTLHARTQIGKYIDTPTYERALHHAKQKADQYESQV
jgi:hypothetical protein